MAAMPSRQPPPNISRAAQLLQRFADNPVAGTGGGSHPGSSFTFDYGTARVKAYPITDAELSRIGLMRGLSSFFLAFGSILAGFCGTAVASLYLSTMPSDVLLAWKAGAWTTGGACVVCYIITAVLIYHGHTETSAIKSRTSF
jgi:hypothetical protein